LEFEISQGSVATRCRQGGNLYGVYTETQISFLQINW